MLAEMLVSVMQVEIQDSEFGVPYLLNNDSILWQEREDGVLCLSAVRAV